MNKLTWPKFLNDTRNQSGLNAAVCTAWKLNDALANSTAYSRQSGEYSYCGPALLFACLSETLPGEGFENFCHANLSRAVQSNLNNPRVSVFGGLSEIGVTAAVLASNTGRYQNLLRQIDLAITPSVRLLLTKIHTEKSLKASDYDLILGVTGIAMYLLTRFTLCRVEHPLLQSALQMLVNLSRRKASGNSSFEIMPQNFVGSFANSKTYPNGLIDCGLAHGIAGPLAVLSLAHSSGVNIPGVKEAITDLAQDLIGYSFYDAIGVNWPPAIPIEKPKAERKKLKAARAAWCYGTPGIARALWLAGVALDQSPYKTIAFDGITAVTKRICENLVDEATFCHGLAGWLQIVMRFANDSKDAKFTILIEQLFDNLLAWHSPESTYGFRNPRNPSSSVDDPQLLSGASGIALVILAAVTRSAPTWDRIFLLS